MPRPGDQHDAPNIQNPFEERTVNEFTAIEIATLQARLNKQLGPEYISKRTGNGGGTVAYLEGNKAITLANEVFGFNGWSSSLRTVQVDFVDENSNTGRVNLGLSIIVRVTLKDGTYHEDVGYGSVTNSPGKAAAFEKAKKEAATDGLKRALRTFGNVLGNCLYDKEYLKKVNTVKSEPVKFNPDNLHRHPTFAPPAPKEDAPVKNELQTPARANQLMRTRTESVLTNKSVGTEFEDEFGSNLFDGVDISEHQGDEFTLESIHADEVSPRLLEGPPKAEMTNGAASNRNSHGQIGVPARQPIPRMQSLPAIRPQNGAPQQPHQQNQGVPRPAAQVPNPPRGPNPQMNNGRRTPLPTTDTQGQPRAVVPPQNQNPPQPPQKQPLRQTPPQATGVNQQALPGQPSAQQQPLNAAPSPMNGRPPVGFVTSRAAELMQNTDTTGPTPNLPAFNPHAESPLPKEQRTPGIDHTRSMKITRQEVNAPNPPQPPPQRPGMNGSRNFINPQMDNNRRIGMPGAHAQSPLANRTTGFKAPGMVGAGTKRPPLADLSNKGGETGEPETKRAKVDGVENDGAVGPLDIVN